MPRRDLMTHGRSGRQSARHHRHHPLDVFHRDFGHWINDFFDEFGVLPFSSMKKQHQETFMPRMDFHEDNDKMVVSAELPGMDEKDIKISLKNQTLTITGEKKSEVENKARDYHHVERRYGSFERSVRLDSEVEAEQVKAEFKNGVLTITLPKTEHAKSQVRQIEVYGS